MFMGHSYIHVTIKGGSTTGKSRCLLPRETLKITFKYSTRHRNIKMVLVYARIPIISGYVLVYIYFSYLAACCASSDFTFSSVMEYFYRAINDQLRSQPYVTYTYSVVFNI